LLADSGFLYSSSIYAPAGVILRKGDVWEIPVSTLRFHEKNGTYTAPRDFSLRLLFGGEIPYGSSFSIGLMGARILKVIDEELKRGLSPVIILHPYELVKPAPSRRLARDLALNPLFLPFLRDKSHFLSDLLRNFPVSPWNLSRRNLKIRNLNELAYVSIRFASYRRTNPFLPESLARSAGFVGLDPG
jgi:hypothetical protein